MLQIYILLGLSLLVASCGQKSEEEISYEDSAWEEEPEEEEWNTLQNVEEKKVAADLLPEPQEVVIYEIPEEGSPPR